MKKPVVLVICDGLGIGQHNDANAWWRAETPNFDDLIKNYPNVLINASGTSVGLPEGQMGNSEVGHLTIGAGRTVYTGLPLINNSIQNGNFFKNSEFIKIFNKIKNNHSTLHIMGLLSPGGVHSHEEHLYSILKFAHNRGVKTVYLHAFGDGRDVKPQSILSSIKNVDQLLKEYGYHWGSISGRYYAMDRDTNFERNVKAYNAIDNNHSPQFHDPIKFINDQYNKEITDEFLVPTSAMHNPGIKNNDAVILFNFRPDRARQLSHLLIGSNLYKYPFANKHIYLLTMMKYPEIDSHVAFKEMEIKMPLGEVLQNNNLKQLRIAETEKYAHVTFFLDGGVEKTFKNETKILVPSKKISSFDLVPEMSSKEITNKLIQNMINYDVIVCNYANADMVGHTGKFVPSVKAMEFLDKQIGRLVFSLNKIGGVLFLTGDHGNIEIMKDSHGNPATKHTTSCVPLICTDKSIELLPGKLANIAPTILDYLGIQNPQEMNNKSLIKK